jgi:hypothetical protein
MEIQKDDSMYTYDRLSNFVKKYKDYTNNIVTSHGGNSDEIYKYYHFEISPKGITTDSLGRLPSKFMSNISWAPLTTTNSTNAWLLNLGKLNSEMLVRERENIQNLPISSGLQYQMLSFNTSLYSNDINTASPSLVNAFIPTGTLPPGVTKIQTGASTSFSNIQSALGVGSNQSLATLYSNVLNKSSSNLIGCEWNGFFKPKHMGGYKLTVNTQNANFFVWIGDQAICEYTPHNSDMNTSNPVISIDIINDKYFPIRIQYYTNITAQSITEPNEFSIDIEYYTHTQREKTNISDYLYTIQNGAYVPPLMYCAFVSTSPENYAVGKMRCYSTVTSITNPVVNKEGFSGLYEIINQYKFDMQNGLYDTGSGDILEYGQLPNNIFYTPVSGGQDSLPNTFSIYRIGTDLRMGKTFQIDTSTTNGIYDMQMIDGNATPSILSYAPSYHEYTNYYPNIQPNGTVVGSTNQSGEQCKENCNANNNCNHYFTYLSNDIPQCVISTDNLTPNYNQINPKNSSVDVGSSALFVRDFQFSEPTCGKVDGTNESDLIKIKTVTATDNYSASFPYSNYLWLSDEVKQVTDVGICGNKQYKKLINDAASILYTDATYFQNGTWSSGREGFEHANRNTSEYTDAIVDTQNAIQRNLQKEQLYAKKMTEVNNKYDTLANKKIPNYLKTRRTLNDNPIYDYNGYELSYVNNVPQNTIQQQVIDDNNELLVKDNLLYVLGSVTTAVLLVFAIVIAKD